MQTQSTRLHEVGKRCSCVRHADAGDTEGRGYASVSFGFKRILVVEADLAEAEALSRGLRRHGHEVTTVENGGDALAAYNEAEIILLELELPDLDGLEICRKIRSDCDVPIILVTGRGPNLTVSSGCKPAPTTAW